MSNKNKLMLDLDKIDFIKVLMMLTVIFGHSIALWLKTGWFNQAPATPSDILSYMIGWLNFTHTYVFTFCSGYLFYYLKIEKGKYHSFWLDILHRAKRLLLPYIIVCVLWAIPIHVIFFGFSMNDIIKQFIFATNPEQLWFLIMIFVVFTIFYSLLELLSIPGFFSGTGVHSHWNKQLLHHLGNNVQRGGTCAIIIIIYLIGVLGPKIIPNVFQIWTACKYIPFFYLGYIFRQKPKNICTKIPTCFYLIVSVVLYSTYYYVESKVGLSFSLRIIEPMCCIVNVLLVITGLSSIKMEKIKGNKLYIFLKKHNFGMYLFHQQLIYIIIAYLNGRVSNFVLVTVSFFVATLVSAFISIVLSRTPIINGILGYK